MFFKASRSFLSNHHVSSCKDVRPTLYRFMHPDETEVGKDLASVYGQMRGVGTGNRKQIFFEHWHVANVMPGLGDTKTNEMQSMSPSSPKGLLGQ